jgi:hypothetical protein
MRKVAVNSKSGTILRGAGKVINAVGIGLVALDMKQNGLTDKNTIDMFFAFYAFVPGVGWVVSGLYFIIDQTIGWKPFIPLLLYQNRAMEGWEETRRSTGDGYWETLKSHGD